MAPRGASNWRRPYTTIYNDNYRYGNSLYSDTLSDIERKYTDALSRTQLRSDRGDLAFSTFAGSALTSSPNPGGSSTSAAVPLSSPKPSASSPRPATQLPTGATSPKDQPFSTFESRLSTALHSAYLTDDFEPLLSSTERRARSLEAMRSRMQEDSSLLSTLPKVTEKPDLEKAPEETKSRRKIIEPTTPPTSIGGGSVSQWKEKCRDLQMQVDELTHAMAETGVKVRDEIYNTKGKFHSELNDLIATVEQTSKQCNDLQRTVKSQAGQLLEFQTAYDDIQRRLQDSQEEVGTWQRRCQHLRKEMDRLRSEMDSDAHRSSGSSRF